MSSPVKPVGAEGSFETPNKTYAQQQKKSITPAKPGASRRLDVENVQHFEQNKKRRKEDVKPRKPEQVYQPLSIYKTEIYEAKVGNKPDRDECWGTSARKEFLARKQHKIAYDFVVNDFIVPPNFDTSLKYGARSGMCHEQRLLRAYKNRLLQLKPESAVDYTDAKSWMMCPECNEMGHFDDECEAAF